MIWTSTSTRCNLGPRATLKRESRSCFDRWIWLCSGLREERACHPCCSQITSPESRCKWPSSMWFDMGPWRLGFPFAVDCPSSHQKDRFEFGNTFAPRWCHLCRRSEGEWRPFPLKIKELVNEWSFLALAGTYDWSLAYDLKCYQGHLWPCSREEPILWSRHHSLKTTGDQIHDRFVDFDCDQWRSRYSLAIIDDNCINEIHWYRNCHKLERTFQIL